MTNIDIQSLYEFMRGRPEYCSLPLDTIHGNCQLVQSLTSGSQGEMHKRIKKACRDLKKLYEGENVNKYLAVLDMVLPDLPGRLFNNYHGSRDTTLMYEELVDLIMDNMLFMLTYYSFSEMPPSDAFCSVFVKAVYHANSNTLRYKKTFLSPRLMEMLADNLEPNCDEMSRVCMCTLIILLERLPMMWRYFLTNKISFKIRITLLKNAGTKCPLVTYMQNLYNRFGVENNLRRLPSWCLVMEACKKFQASDIKKASELLSEVVEQKSLCEQQMLQSGVLFHLENLLVKFVYGESGVKSFLKAFLKFGREVRTNCVPHVVSYRRLVQQLLAILRFQWNSFEKVVRKSQNLSSVEFNAIRILDEEVRLTLNLLQCLFVLNSSWHQWFDLVDAPQILIKEEFINHQITHKIQRDLKSSTTSMSAVMRMSSFIKMCPAILPFKLRNESFRELVERNYPNHALTYIVSRNYVFDQVYRVFGAYSSKSSCRWNFQFKNENGTGNGPTKEVYSLLSQELQRYDLNLWCGESAPCMKNDVKMYNYSARGLFPKTSDVESSCNLFNFLGKILAKAFLDKHLLDIPLSKEFFLCLTSNRHSHLRKDYYDIPLVFPIIDNLIQELICIKNQKYLIQSDPYMTEEEKQETIQFLTFQDGSSFDDLCLNFTLPGTEEELVEDGYNNILSPLNVEEYLEALSKYKMKMEPSKEFKAILDGFNEILPLRPLDFFLPVELQAFLCGSRFETWSPEYLSSSCIVTNGYTTTSKPVQFLFEVLSSFSDHEKKLFLHFTTSRFLLPVGGLQKLTPRMTIAKMTMFGEEIKLPTALTCTNILFLPEYSSVEVTREKLLYAITEGGKSFEFV